MASRNGKKNVGGRPRSREPSALFQRVEILTKRRGLSLQDVAIRAGVSVACIYQLDDPRISTAKAIADALGVTVDRLAFPRPRSAPRSTA
jgi:transcriptional regulator with XRE-family HTH domain